MKVLWLDDDAPSSRRVVGDVVVIPAQTCASAIDILAQEDPLPQWVIVDLIVPQGGWGDRLLRLPGLEFLEYMRATYPGKIRFAAYSVLITGKIRERIQRAGAVRIFSKATTSFLGVLHELREHDAVHEFLPPHPETGKGLTEDLKGRLQRVLSEHIAKHFSSVQPFSPEALREIYSAVLVLEEDEEKRMRAYQTLEALREDSVEYHNAGTFSSELSELRHLIDAIVDEKRSRDDYDVFLCYNSRDQEEVESIGRKLLGSGVLPWFDQWELRPGERWRGVLEGRVEKIRTAAVFVGKQGIGPWQDLEVDSLLEQFKSRKAPVIPVILSTAPPIPPISPFLRSAQWVDFRKGDRTAFNALIWGITGWRIKT